MKRLHARASLRRAAVLTAAVSMLAVLAVAGAACGGRTVVERRVIEYPTAPSDSARSWVGHTREALEKVWGNPSSTAPDGEGGVVLTYTGASQVSVTHEKRHDHPSIAEPPIEPLESTQYRSEREDGRFWLDADGIIYRYWMRPALFESREKDPPGVGPGSELDEGFRSE